MQPGSSIMPGKVNPVVPEVVNQICFQIIGNDVTVSMASDVQNSIGLVTALNPVLGYEKSASIAKEALRTGASVYDLVLAKGWLTKDRLEELLKPENMTHPRLTR